MKTPKINSNVYSICPDCARENGAVWPEGHAATFWPGKCQVCGQDKGLCDVSDWNWPKGKTPATFSLTRRD